MLQKIGLSFALVIMFATILAILNESHPNLTDKNFVVICLFSIGLVLYTLSGNNKSKQ